MIKSLFTTLTSNISCYFARSISGLLLTGLIWQGISLGIDMAVAAPLVAATSNSEVVDRLGDKAESQIDRAKSALKDGERSVKNTLDKAGAKLDMSVDKTKIHNNLNADKSEQYSGDTPDRVQKIADRNSKQAEDFSKKTTEKAKNFFGF